MSVRAIGEDQYGIVLAYCPVVNTFLMKTTTSFFVLAAVVLSSACSSYKRIGDLTVLANRNVGSTADYVLVEREVKAVAKMQNDDALERAVDQATASVAGGEYMQNVQVYVKSNGKKVRVVGDVWGTPASAASAATGLALADNADLSAFKVGDAVTFRANGVYVDGKIVGVNIENAVIDYETPAGRTRRKEVPFEDLTRIGAEGATIARQR